MLRELLKKLWTHGEWEPLVEHLQALARRHKIFCAVLAAHLSFVLTLIIGPFLMPRRVLTPSPAPMPVEMQAAPAEPKAGEPGGPPPAPAQTPTVRKQDVVMPKTPPKTLPDKAKPKPKPAPPVKPPPVIKPDNSLKQRLKSKINQASPTAASAPVTPAPGTPSDRTADGNQEQGVPAIDVAGRFPYNWYLSLIQAKISAKWDKPTGILMTSEGMACAVSFRIFRDGRIEGVELAASSGNDILDASAMDAVNGSNPMPPLPDRFDSEYIDVRLSFNLVK